MSGDTVWAAGKDVIPLLTEDSWMGRVSLVGGL